jgi:3-oxoacyl-[acyl-carrier-protein] synthase II
VTGRVALTGIGAVTPAGLGREATWRKLLAGRSAVGPIESFDTAPFMTRIAAEVRRFDPSAFMPSKRVRRTARFSQMAIVAAREAVSDAGLDWEVEDRERVGVVVNAAVAGFDTVEAATRLLALSSPAAAFIPSSLTNMPACEIAMDLSVHGPVNASALACASGLYALLEGRQMILAGEADVAICGGTDAAITPVMFAGLDAMGALSRRNEDPAGASRPFAADRDGFVFGEGAVIIVLESMEHASRRAAVAYATLDGGALTCDAFHQSAPHPHAKYASAAVALALQRSSADPASVDYICAHGTGTQANDVAETRAIRTAFQKHADDVAISSPKSMVGHLIGAAGALGAMVCALSIRDSVVPPTINLSVPDPECDLDYVPHVARAMPVDIAIANAFGFGGQNCVAVFRSPPRSAS